LIKSSLAAGLTVAFVSAFRAVPPWLEFAKGMRFSDSRELV